jgi:hypothetical protein
VPQLGRVLVQAVVQLAGARVAERGTGLGAEVLEDVHRQGFPVAQDGAQPRVGDHEPHQVAAVGGHGLRAAPQGAPGGVPGEQVEVAVQQYGGAGRPGVEDGPDGGREAPGLGVGGGRFVVAGQAHRVAQSRRVEPQRPGDGGQHLP